MLNINRGHNEKLKEMCKSLKDYSEYTERVREYAQVKPVEEAGNRQSVSVFRKGFFQSFETKQSGGETSEYL